MRAVQMPVAFAPKARQGTLDDPRMEEPGVCGKQSQRSYTCTPPPSFSQLYFSLHFSTEMAWASASNTGVPNLNELGISATRSVCSIRARIAVTLASASIRVE